MIRLKLFTLALASLALWGCSPAAPPPPAATYTPKPTAASTATVAPEPKATLDPAALQAAMFQAAREDDVDRMAELIAAGADVNATGELGVPALGIAAGRGNVEMTNLLLAAGAEWDTKFFHQSLEASGSVEIVQIFINQGASLTETTNSYGTPVLGLAARNGYVDIGILLIESGADLYQGDNWNDPALNIAAYRGRLEFVKMLLDRQVEVNTPNISGQTALDHARSQGHDEVVAVLEAAGALRGKDLP